MLLSVDWDYFSGCVEYVFDAPIWGSKDMAFDRTEAWVERAIRRKGDLSKDFPLLEDWQWLEQFAGIKTFATLSHDDAYGLLEQRKFSEVFNLDSHHDLFSLSGDPERLRPGNWAGLALQRALIQTYTCSYPMWHAGLRVAEGFDLKRTRQEWPARFARMPAQLRREPLHTLTFDNIEAVLLVQSPSWTSPLHDEMFFRLCDLLKAEYISIPLDRTALFSALSVH